MNNNETGGGYSPNIQIKDEWKQQGEVYRLIDTGAGPLKLEILTEDSGWKNEADHFAWGVMCRRISILKNMSIDGERLISFIIEKNLVIAESEGISVWAKNAPEIINNYMATVKCACGSSRFTHSHDCMHGLPQTHEVGSERYECANCGMTYFKEAGQHIGLKYIID